MLLGETNSRAVLAVSPEWRTNHDGYAPDPAVLEALRSAAAALGADLHVEVVFGSWCGDSRSHVPKYTKIQRLLAKDRIRTTYLGVDRDKKDPGGTVAGKNVERVPTFIVTFKGGEIGRIVETPAVSIEKDLLEILSRARRP